MGLSTGTRLGPYEIQSALGAGGMGEVYRARDTRLERTVAVKVLAEHLSATSELKQRLEREAKTLSSLSHQHICHLYDIGSQDGTDYIVMEFLEGETLAARLQRGPMPLPEIFKTGVELADALWVAHRAGIVHRDLKPGNIMLTRTGAKLMDFGLAKPVAMGAAASGTAMLLSAAHTMTSNAPSPLTSVGNVVGTIQYMSPEQIGGQAADARSDIFAFGAVLYEMATGKRAFDGKSQISVASAILEKTPEPITSVRPLTPAALEHVVKTCLEKSPDDRFQTAHDVKLQLKWALESGSSSSIAAMPGAVHLGRKRREQIAWAVAAVLLLAIIGLGYAWVAAKPSPPPLRATLLAPPGLRFALLNRSGPPALSPDGSRVAFIASKDGRHSLWVRSLDNLDAVELPGTEGAFSPFWSPDGKTVGYFANGKMWRMDVEHGAAVAIADAPNGRGASWTADGVIIFAPNTGTAILRVAATGGATAPATAQPSGISSHRWPYFLADGKHFIYLFSPTGAGDDGNEIRLASLDSSKESVLLHGRYYLSEPADGYLLAVRNGLLTAQKLDVKAGALIGEVMAVAEHVQCDDIVAGAVFSAANNVVVYEEGGAVAAEQMVWTDATGKTLGLASEGNLFEESRLSPDGNRIAFPEGSLQDLWMTDFKTGARSRVSFGGSLATAPAWSPDGRTIYFSFSQGTGRLQIFSRPADGSRPQQLVLKSDLDISVADISPDGKYLLYEEGDANSSSLKAYPLSGAGPTIKVLEHLGGVVPGGLSSGVNVRLSPDGGWLAYQGNDSGRNEVYVSRFPEGGGKYQVSLSGGTMPVWSRDGKRLYYLDPTQKMTVVDVQAGKDSIQIGRPQTLFQTGIRSSITQGGFDVTPDGRFLLINSMTDSEVPLTLVENWQAGLKH